MKIDLHIHSKTCSDGLFSIKELLDEAKNREIGLISLTDHDNISCQKQAVGLAAKYSISYLTGVELNVSFHYQNSQVYSLDFLGYQFNIENMALNEKLQRLRAHRKDRAQQILNRLNQEFEKEGIALFTAQDLQNIEDSVDGTFGRPHIADYLVEKGIVKSRQAAFDKYLVKCNMPKYPLSIEEASRLIREAGGKLVLAHPADPFGTSLVSINSDLSKQTRIIHEHMLKYIDGIECWHFRHNLKTTAHYVEFAKKHGLIMTGGSDCHQKPVIMGTMDIPDWIAHQFAE